MFNCDIRFVRLTAPKGCQVIESYLEEISREAFVGDPSQLRSYAEWGYAPPSAGNTVGANPLGNATVPADVDTYAFPRRDTDAGIAEVRQQTDAIHSRGLAAAGFPPHLGGELFETGCRLRGFEQFCGDLVRNPDLAAYLIESLAWIHTECAVILAKGGCDILCLDDDMGHPTGLMVGPATYRRFFKPHMAKVIAAARHVNPDVKVFYHSDGDITQILDDLVEIGIEVIEPVQPDCMNPLAIRRRYGSRLAFWGTVGTAAMWAFGSIQDVWDEVQQRIETLGPTGLILAPAYDFTRDFGIDKLKAFFAAAEHHGGERLT
jgi:uroporphyrinogen decarboxylase